MRYPFLSEPWMAALESLRAEAPEPPLEAKGLTVNLVIRGGPGGDVGAHIRDGWLDRGLADDAPTTVTATYDVARKLVIEGDPNLLLVAVMAGDITVAGQAVNLVALQGAFASVSTEHLAFHRKVQHLTS